MLCLHLRVDANRGALLLLSCMPLELCHVSGDGRMLESHREQKQDLH